MIQRKFDPARFIQECRNALHGADAQGQIRELLAREMDDSAAVLYGLGAPTKGGLHTLYRSPNLTILNIVWGPLMQLMPHDHNIWALIGIYTGREDNIFWRRSGGRLEAVGATAISKGEVVSMPRDIIHSVANPIGKLSGAIHVYGGDFFNVPRSEWDPETLIERAWDAQATAKTFELANAHFFEDLVRP